MRQNICKPETQQYTLIVDEHCHQTLLCVHAVRKLHDHARQSIPPLQKQGLEGSQETLKADERKGNNDHSATKRNEGDTTRQDDALASPSGRCEHPGSPASRTSATMGPEAGGRWGAVSCEQDRDAPTLLTSTGREVKTISTNSERGTRRRETYLHHCPCTPPTFSYCKPLSHQIAPACLAHEEGT